jgi:hypothetical protein
MTGVKYLYTVIPHHDGLRALKFFLDKRPSQEPSTAVLVRLAELVLTLNNFFLSWRALYQKINGVSMRTKMCPKYANLQYLLVLWKNKSSNNTLIPSLITLVGT